MDEPNAVDSRSIAIAYLTYVRDRDPELSWAWDKVDAEGWHDPEAKWDVILQLVGLAESDVELQAIGAGPLEDLIGMYGPRVIDRVALQAGADPKFMAALAAVWVTEERSTAEVRRRIAEILP